MELVDILALPARPTHEYRHAAFRLPTNGGALQEWLRDFNRAVRPLARSNEYQVIVEVTQ